MRAAKLRKLISVAARFEPIPTRFHDFHTLSECTFGVSTTLPIIINIIMSVGICVVIVICCTDIVNDNQCTPHDSCTDSHIDCMTKMLMINRVIVVVCARQSHL